MSEIYNYIIKVLEIISTISKYLGALTFLVTVFLFLRYFGHKYKKPILNIFNKNSFFGFFLLYKIVISFRKNPNVLMRMFCEYIIVQDYKNKRLTTKNLRFYYKNFLQEYVKKDYDSIDIDSTFEVIEIYSSPYVTRYFDFYGNPKNIKKYDIDTRKVLSFRLYFKVKNGYLFPAILIPSLQEHYNDDWSSIVDRYFENAKTSRNLSELYMFYTWLMWGPSYRPRYKEQGHKIMQYGMGDEAMTFNVVLNDLESSIKLWKRMGEAEEYIHGLQCSLKLRVNEKHSYFEKNFNKFGSEISPFIRKILKSNLQVISEHVSYEIISTEEYKYFTAYIWALFIKGEKQGLKENLDINDCVVFFEHTNIVEPKTYNFFLESIVTKILAHFKEVFKDSKDTNFKEKYFLNNCSDNAIIKRLNIAIEEIKEKEKDFGKWLEEHFVFDDSITIGALLDLFEQEFSQKEKKLTFTKIDIDCEKSVDLLCLFYGSVYLPNFLNENERESLENIIRYLKNEKNGKNGKNHYYILIATIDDEVVGGIIADYFSEINSGVFEYLVVKNKYRRKQIGSRLVEEMINIFNKDAKKYHERKIDYIFIEVDKSQNITGEIREKKRGVAEFWNSQKFSILDFDYVQPSLEPKKEIGENLYLGIRICNPELFDKPIEKNLVKKFLTLYAKYAMSIDFPEDDIAIIRNYENIDDKKTIELKPIDKDFKKEN